MRFSRLLARFRLTVRQTCCCNCLILLALYLTVREVYGSQMNAETQIEQAAIAPVVDSGESNKPKRGGKRPGAGRKRNLVKRLLKGVTRDTIAAAVQDIDVGAIIAGPLKLKRELVRLQTLNFVFDRLQGNPKQD